MGSCVFTACGLSFDVDEFLKTSNFKPGLIYHKGEAVALERQPRPHTGFLLAICQDDGEGLRVPPMTPRWPKILPAGLHTRPGATSPGG